MADTIECVQSRVGTIETFTGKIFNVLEPDQDLICIEDIAHALAHLCRFGGHCQSFYSVAQHSCRAAEILPCLEALLHDASEAYLVDLPRPIKLNMPQYKAMESRLDMAIRKRFGLRSDPELWGQVKEVDNQLLRSEAQQFMRTGGSGWDWTGCDAVIVQPVSMALSPRSAESEFLKTYKKFV